jgi:histidinol-phosphate/aromatic aminotransferase/cobyric acid decarboxylase-like protein
MGHPVDAEELLITAGAPRRMRALLQCSVHSVHPLATFASLYACPQSAELRTCHAAGVSHGLDLACRQLGCPGDQILVEQPTYFLAGSILRQAGLQPVSVWPRCLDLKDRNLCTPQLVCSRKGPAGLTPQQLSRAAGAGPHWA